MERRTPKKTTASHTAIGNRIRAERAARRMTQLALADALGITFEQLRKYETGRSLISARRLQQIASLLGVPVEAFTRPDGKAIRSGATDLTLLDQAGALRLIRAYAALPTPRMKHALVRLAERMAGMAS
jgi:transcriptional regulator with XRE-family HTH domain